MMALPVKILHSEGNNPA